MKASKVPAVHGVIGCSQRSFQLAWRCYQLLSGFLAKRHLRRVSRQFCLSANDKVVHRSLDIYLTAEENIS